jgi:hypothetical protein
MAYAEILPARSKCGEAIEIQIMSMLKTWSTFLTRYANYGAGVI